MEQQGNQDYRRLPPPEAPPENQQLQQQPPQKCPRCDSINTKFCYYNNYSLTQPRHYCKNCRRYWTHGGTLRNVPVGGGCRKGKRAKNSAAAVGENSRPQPPPPTPQQSEQQIQQNLTTPATVDLPPAIIPATSYFSGGGFLSSLVKIQSLSQTQHNQEQINVGLGGGGQFGNVSNLSLVQGMNFTSFRSQDQQIQNPNEFFQMGNRDQNVELPIYPSDHQSLIDQPNRPIGSWNQNPLMNNTNPNQWSDLPGYGPPT